MKTPEKGYRTIDEYVVAFPEPIQKILRKFREAIRESAPEAAEAISYQMPTFKLNGNLVHFAAAKNHIGFYPTPSAIEAFKEELSDYELSKGTIRFPLNKPVPFDLVKRMVGFRVKEALGEKKDLKLMHR